MGATANLTNDIAANATVTIDTTSRTLGVLNIGDTNGTHRFTVTSSGGGTLTFDNSLSNAQLNITSSSGSAGAALSGPLLMAGSLDLSNASTGGLTFNSGATISASSAGTKTILNKGSGSGSTTIGSIISNGSGTVAVIQNSTTSNLTLTGVNTYTGSTTVAAGTLAIGPSGSIANTSSIAVSSGATFSNNLTSGVVRVALGLTEGATLSSSSSAVNDFINDKGLTVTASLSDGFNTIALDSLLKAGNSGSDANKGKLTFLLSSITPGTYTNIFSGLPTGLFASVSVASTALSGTGGNTWSGSDVSFAYTFTDSATTAGSMSLVISAIPEPSAYAALAGMAACAVALRRRRGRSLPYIN